jgi:hypothetical protein
MYIKDDLYRRKIDSLEELEEYIARTMSSIQDRCHRCGRLINHPIEARTSDLVLFTRIMRSAFAVMDRHGIMKDLLADTRTERLIAAANKRISEITTSDEKLTAFLLSIEMK